MMKYLTLVPSYTQSCIFDESKERTVALESLCLPENLMSRLLSWSAQYNKIIPLGEVERLELSLEIEALDADGISLAKEIERALSDGTKVRYYSEGKLRYL